MTTGKIADRTPERRKFGRTGFEITRVGLGSWAIGGGGWEFGWGPQNDEASKQAIRRAMGIGINWVDTAPAYGTGHSEEIIGSVLPTLTPAPHVFTKVSLRWDSQRRISHNLKADSIRFEVNESRRRLGVGQLDLVQVHWPDPEPDIEEGWRTLAELKDHGLVRHIGVSNFDVAQMERAAAIAPVETLQPAYSLVHPDVEQEILPYARAHGIGVIVYSPMGSGLLTGTMTRERVALLAPDDWRRQDPDFQGERLERSVALAALLTELGREHGGRPAGTVAIAWTLANPAVTGAIVGARSPGQVDDIAGALTLRLTAQDLERISTFRSERP